jgi:hypothetical protein
MQQKHNKPKKCEFRLCQHLEGTVDHIISACTVLTNNMCFKETRQCDLK